MTTPAWPTPQDLQDVQGDIILGFPKRTEDFIFFNIQNAAAFKRDLKQLIPAITSTADIQKLRKDIDDHKKSGKHGLLKAVGINIAFSVKGLEKLGITDDLGDASFKKGQLGNASALGDTGKTDSSGNFVPDWLEPFKNEIDGVILVAGDSRESVQEGDNKVEHVLGHSIKEVFKVKGQTRPGKEKGHEHFGFLDGISSPAIDAVTGHLPGQIVVPPGVIITGVTDGDSVARPAWAKNGSFLVYRQLQQLVPEFNKFLHDNPVVVDGLPRDKGSELLGARFFGRWKSGAPIELSPLKDDPELAKDKQRNNNFDFSGESFNDQTKCPFAAHIRKTNPRADLLQPFGSGALLPHMIMRKSITYGPEVTPEEAKENKTKVDRGLAFVCYQSNVVQGFEFVQESWSNNTKFPPQKNVAQPGFDPIIGQNNGQARDVAGLQIKNQAGNTTLPIEFVVSKGGAYFFTPSISALKTKLTA
ncbi:DYP1 [Sanghuangporus vaninii]